MAMHRESAARHVEYLMEQAVRFIDTTYPLTYLAGQDRAAHAALVAQYVQASVRLMTEQA
jgi:hypothetical protein